MERAVDVEISDASTASELPCSHLRIQTICREKSQELAGGIDFSKVFPREAVENTIT